MTNEYGGSGGGAVVRVDAALTASAATRMLDIRLAADERWRAALSELEVVEPACGTLTAGPALADAHRRALADAAATLQALGDAVEADVDRLLQVGFNQREADLAAMRRTVAGPWR